MVKGVNKNVIEIADTGNVFFERAILFVRPASKDSDSEHLHRRANEFLSTLKMRSWVYPRGRLFIAAIKLAAAASLGAAAAVFFLK